MAYEALFDIFDIIIVLQGLNELISCKIHGLRAISQFYVYADLFEFVDKYFCFGSVK